METRIHTASNLYKYIENARQMENLELQIKQKEKDFKAYEELQNIYKKMGCMNMFEVSEERCSAIELEILLLKLKRNKIEEQMIKFEIAAFLED